MGRAREGKTSLKGTETLIAPATRSFTRSVLGGTPHSRSGSSMHETPFNTWFLSLTHSSLEFAASQPHVEPARSEPGAAIHDGQQERIPGQRHDLNRCTLQDKVREILRVFKEPVSLETP
jgi:hypothetical protein